MTSFRGLVLILLVLLVLLSGSVAMAQGGMIMTNTPQAAGADDVSAPVVEVVSPAEADESVIDGLINTIVPQVLLFAGIAVIVVGVVLLVIFVFFIRSVVPALKASISEEWQPVIFPILNGLESSLSGAAINFAKRLEAKAKETETTIDDDLIERILRSLDPPESASADNRF